MTERVRFALPIQVVFHRSSGPPIEIGAKEEHKATLICKRTWRREFAAGDLLTCEIRRAPIEVRERLAQYLDGLEGNGADLQQGLGA
jgi:hypothetical protein